jgi:hypothetical protein
MATSKKPPRRTVLVPLVLQIAGSGLVTLALGMVAIPVGVAFAGVACLAFGIAAERGN